jgi:hypothetical protein
MAELKVIEDRLAPSAVAGACRLWAVVRTVPMSEVAARPRALAADGVLELDIARVVGIDAETLRSIIGDELDVGATKGECQGRRVPVP